MKKITKGLVLSSALSILLIGTLSTVSAHQGYYASGNYLDVNGISTVYTTYAGGGGDAVSVKLVVWSASNGSQVGTKTVGASVDQYVEHTCWGPAGHMRYGVVDLRGYHTPGFNS